MEKKFNELTVQELGSILDEGYNNLDDLKSCAHNILNHIRQSLSKYKNRPVFQLDICTTIIPFYFIYKYALTDTANYSGSDIYSDIYTDIYSSIMKQCKKVKDTNDFVKPETASILKSALNAWWDRVKVPQKEECKTSWLEKSLDEVGQSILDIQPSLWREYLQNVTIKADFDVELPDYLSNPSDTTEEPTPEPDGITYKDIKNYLLDGGVSQIILTGAPGTGKTKVAKELASFLGSDLTWEKPKEEKFPKYKLVQFHPSYDYTDFVEGLRPVEIKSTDKNDSTITFKKVDGIFKHFCRKVVKKNEPDKKYFFIIDEINRADLSKVFGELMYCLEKDKRGEENKIDTQYQNLSTYDTESQQELNDEDDVFAEGFYIPENVVIIGTMNDIDRSVESMDMALRRRFTWYEVVVDKDLLNESLAKIFPDLFDKDPKSITELAKRINKFNKSKMNDSEHGLNKHYYISQGQFTDLPLDSNKKNDINDILKKAWNSRVKGLIEEYVRGEYDAKKFVEDCENAFLGKSPQNKKTQGEENSDQ